MDTSREPLASAPNRLNVAMATKGDRLSTCAGNLPESGSACSRPIVIPPDGPQSFIAPSHVKRAHDSIDEHKPDEISNNDPRLHMEPQNCDQIRRKIDTFIVNTSMTQGDFQNLIEVSAHSFRTFMGQSGKTKGEGSDTYTRATIFFRKREIQGLKMPRKRIMKKTKTGDSNSEKGSGSRGSVTSKDKDFDVSGVHLDGETDEHVAIFDTCDEVRRKISHHMKQPGVTQASLARSIGAMIPGDSKVSASQLSDFRSRRGPRTGNASRAFYGAYVFFEKLRIKAGKPKSKHRQQMEEAWAAEGGFPREGGNHLLLFRGERAYVDNLGLTHVH